MSDLLKAEQSSRRKSLRRYGNTRDIIDKKDGNKYLVVWSKPGYGIDNDGQAARITLLRTWIVVPTGKTIEEMMGKKEEEAREIDL
jgi:hypothetical protein